MESCVDTNFHLKDHSLDLRKRTGSFYTPAEIAHEITSNALSDWLLTNSGAMLQNLKKVTILDPAVGDGIFLLSAGECLLRMRKMAGDVKEHREIRKEIAESSLYGVDVQVNAVNACTERISDWVSQGNQEQYSQGLQSVNIQKGNSLLGEIKSISKDQQLFEQFNWRESFPQIFNRNQSGFDIILGNPPYGNLLNNDDKKQVGQFCREQISGGRKGTWNVASLFIARAYEVLREGGHLCFLIPNSILRVGQFQKTRQFLLNKMQLKRIIDYGSPFEDVTLEMIGIFGRKSMDDTTSPIEIKSRREDVPISNSINPAIFERGSIFSIYHDEIFEEIVEKGEQGILKANRGRDIPKKHVRKKGDKEYPIPYITSGRSVKRYCIDDKYKIFTDDWYKSDLKLSESYNETFLVATKNYPYPRCVLKPKGTIHGGGIVRITSRRQDFSNRVAGLILNSEIMRYVCIKYLTNYSQLTTCLNTGIIEDLPLIIPKYPDIFETLFDNLQYLYSNQRLSSQTSHFLDGAADALIYSMYFDDINNLEEEFKKAIGGFKNINPKHLKEALLDLDDRIRATLNSKVVKRIRESPRIS